MLYYINKSYKFDLSVIDSKGSFVSGLAVTYKVYKSSDNSLIDSGSMTEVGASGIYQTPSQTFTAIAKYRIEYYTPTKYENTTETVLIIEDLDERIARILGLSQENYRIFSPVYEIKNRQSCMTSGTIKTYPSAADCEANTNQIATYEVTATYNNKAEMTDYKVKRTA